MEQLNWLPGHPNLRAAIAAARSQSDPGARLASAAQLSGYRRDLIATEALARLQADCISQDVSALGLRDMRVALLGSHTLSHLASSIRVAGLHRGLSIKVHVGGYGLYRQELMDGDPALAEFAPHLVLLAVDEFDVAFGLRLQATEPQIASGISQRVEEARHLWRLARERLGAIPVQQTLVSTGAPLFGHYETMVPASPLALAERFNRELRAAAQQDGVLLLDVASEAARQGILPLMIDLVHWHHAKQLISPLLAPTYGDWVARLAAAVGGLSRKCVVLDLDNTLWGGVVGDDGLEGLRLGQGSAEGEVFSAFQRYLSMLAARGIILAVCSKNDPAVAEAAFSGHPEMILRRAEIAAFVANWDDKATNIRKIAKLLDIGVDSLVFVDDNPAERAIVRRELPSVAVPELPDEPALWPATLADAGYFEASSFTHEDAARGRSYAENAVRHAQLSRTTDLTAYLRDLDMVMAVNRIGSADIARATQLVNKTNQFNLTTRRYTELELTRFAAAPESIALCFRLRDRFGDNGLISVILAEPAEDDPTALLIDTWLMSCRVLGRSVEVAALEALLVEAVARGFNTILGEYLPTPRNKMVAAHYEKLEFKACPRPVSRPDGGTCWRLNLDSLPRYSHQIRLELPAANPRQMPLLQAS
jgi:FkbH-like protein